MYFYLLAPFYALGGFRTAAVQVGALVINVGALALIAWAASVFAPPLAISVVIAAVWLAVRSGDMLVSVWNPHVIVLPMAAFLVLAAAFAATGRSRFAVWLAAIGSFLSQTHLAVVPIVFGIGVLVAAHQRRALRGRFGAAVALMLIVLWMPTLLEQFRSQPGNLTRLAAFFIEPAGGQSLSVAAAAWSAMIVAPVRTSFAVAAGSDFSPRLSWPAAAAAAEIAALVAAAISRRTHSQATAWFAAVCAIAAVLALAATTGIRDQIVDHEIFWAAGVGALNVGVLAGTVFSRAGVSVYRSRDTPALRSRPFVPSVSIAAVAIAAAVGVLALDRTIHRTRTLDDHAVDVVVDGLTDAARAGALARPLVHIEPSIWPIAAGALLQVDKHGGRFAVDDRWRTMFGDALAATGGEDGELTIAGSRERPLVIRNR